VRSASAGSYLAANMVVRREAFSASGGFQRLRRDAPARWDHGFREDTDWGLRVVAAAGPIGFAADAFVEHPFEIATLARHLRTALFFEVDAAFASLHPGYFRRQSGLFGRVRIRLATATAAASIAGLVARRPALTVLAPVAGGFLESARIEVELRSLGHGVPAAATVRDVVLRTPRSAAWMLVAGLARIFGIAAVRTGSWPLRESGSGTTKVSDPLPVEPPVQDRP